MLLYITLVAVFIVLIVVAFVIYKIFFTKKTLVKVTDRKVEKKISIDKIFVYPEGYDISLQSTLGYKDEYIQIVETEDDDIYELRINDDYIGYVDGTDYIVMKSHYFENFSRLKVKIGRIKDKIHTITSVTDDRVLIYRRSDNIFSFIRSSEIDSLEKYNSRKLIFEIAKRT